MNGQVVSSTFKTQLMALSYHVNKGNFLSVKQSEPLLIKSLLALVPNNSVGKIESLKRVAWLWLKEIGNAIKGQDVSMLQQAYNEFMRVYVLMENGGEMTLEDVIENKKETFVPNNKDVTIVAMDRKEETDVNKYSNASSAYDSYSCSLSDDLFNEELFQKVDDQVGNFFMEKETKEVTPEKVNHNLSCLNPDYLHDKLSQLVEEKLNKFMPEYLERKLLQYDIAKIGDISKIYKKKDNANVYKNPYNKVKKVNANGSKNPYQKGNGKRKNDEYHNQMVRNVPVHDMKLRNNKRQLKGSK